MGDQPGTKTVSDKPFLTDIKTLRERARKHIEQGAITEGYKADRDTVNKLLNEALATEIICVLRYKRHYFMATGINAESVAAEFLQSLPEQPGRASSTGERARHLSVGEQPVVDLPRWRSAGRHCRTGVPAARHPACTDDGP